MSKPNDASTRWLFTRLCGPHVRVIYCPVRYRQLGSPDNSNDTISMGALGARWGVGRDTVRRIPFKDLPYQRRGEKIVRRRYRLIDIEAYEARTPVAPWELRKTVTQRRSSAVSPVRRRAEWRDIKPLLAEARKALERRTTSPTITPSASERHERPKRPVSARDAAVRTMRLTGATHQTIATAFEISTTRVGQILFWTGGDPWYEVEEANRVNREAERVAQAERHKKEVALRKAHSHALTCNRMVDGLRRCARRRGYLPAPFGSRFPTWVGFYAQDYMRAFGSLDDALKTAGLAPATLRRRPIKSTGTKQSTS